MNHRLQQRIESIMQADAVRGEAPLRALLHTASVLYGGAVKFRNTCYNAGIVKARQLPCRVISIGNIAAGGTGKTPMTIYLALYLRQMGYRPAVLSRGFRGKAENEGAVVSNGYNILCEPEEAGDEPFLIASKLKGIPVLVGSNRFLSGMRALTEFDPDIILLDDGFQHRRLHRDVDLVLLDAARSFGNGYLLPRGILREPVSGLHRGDGFVLTRSGGKADVSELNRIYPDKPVFRSDHEPYLAGIFDGRKPIAMEALPYHQVTGWEAISKKRIFVFSGIARNPEFAAMLAGKGVTVTGRAEFPDHHRYTEADLARIIDSAAETNAELLATTEKDYVRIAGRIPGHIPVAVIGVIIRFFENDESDFLQFIRRKLSMAKNNHKAQK